MSALIPVGNGHARALRSFIASCSHAYCASRSLYSVVRSACVTPSIESTIGHARSYVGYAL